MTILITGATGTVGRHLITELLEQAIPVRALVRDSGRARSTFGGQVDLVAAEFADRKGIAAAMAGIEQVYVVTPNHPQQVEWETNVIDAAAAAGVRRIVKQSTVGAEIGSPLEFWDAHGRLESHLRSVGVPSVVLRANFFMTNLLMSARSVREAGAMFLPAAGAKVAMVDPRDIAHAAAAVLADHTIGDASFDLTGPDAVTFDDVAAALSEATGRIVGFVPVPDEAARAQLLETGMPEWFAANLVTLFGLMREGAAAPVADGVRALTGREPTTLSTFVDDNLAAFSAGRN
jgi:uncharacterized protein YbjT (DUF2867 family)